MRSRYQVGDSIRLTVTFTDLAGAPADPGVVVCKIKSQTAVLSLPAVTRVSTGVYYADFVMSESGTYYWRWAGTGGAATAADEGHLFVAASAF
jgi:hypothetical protein